MTKYVHVVAHLTTDELEQRYRKADDPVERSHLQIVWRLSRGKHVREVAEATGYCANWIRIVARRYNQHGPAVLADQRQHNKGASSLLTGEHQHQLQQAASRKLPLMAACGLAQRSESRMGGRTGRTIHPQRGWEYLKRLGFSLQVPRPRHHKADPSSKSCSSVSCQSRSDRSSTPILTPRWNGWRDG